jgi:hypothetical protein
VELWYPRSCFDVFGGKLGASCFLLYTFDLLCKGIPSSLCIGLAIVALFIKRSEGLFRGGEELFDEETI